MGKYADRLQSTRDRIKQALGDKGNPKTIDQSLTDANPNRSSGLPEYIYNCQKSVYAYEMLRRGYDVEALPRIFGGTDVGAENWMYVMENAVWENVGDTADKNKIKILNNMAKYGDGARAAIYVKWKGHDSAHMFVAEQQGGATVFLDPRSGQYYDVLSRMGDVESSKTKICRLDNLNPTALIADCVKKRR